LPLKGREIPAVTVKSPTIRPLYCPPPRLLKIRGQLRNQHVEAG
jgi:hypothetical protein